MLSCYCLLLEPSSAKMETAQACLGPRRQVAKYHLGTAGAEQQRFPALTPCSPPIPPHGQPYLATHAGTTPTAKYLPGTKIRGTKSLVPKYHLGTTRQWRRPSVPNTNTSPRRAGGQAKNLAHVTPGLLHHDETRSATTTIQITTEPKLTT